MSRRNATVDELERRLKDDAGRIEVRISPELDERLRASLDAAEPASRPAPVSRPRWFWWASSLTGAAGALLLIALVNFGSAPEAPPTVASPPSPPLLRPVLDVRQAVMLGPLESELDNLKRDLARAEAALREDVDQIFGEPGSDLETDAGSDPGS